MSQMQKVNSTCGAPMGRPSSGSNPEHKVRVFQVILNFGGYDDGGAYWGCGAPLYCATDGADFTQYTRAASRLHAVVKFGLSVSDLAKPPASDYRKAYKAFTQWGREDLAVFIADCDFLGFAKYKGE